MFVHAGRTRREMKPISEKKTTHNSGEIDESDA